MSRYEISLINNRKRDPYNLILETHSSIHQSPVRLGKQINLIISNRLKEMVVLYRLQHIRVYLSGHLFFHKFSSSIVFQHLVLPSFLCII